MLTGISDQYICSRGWRLCLFHLRISSGVIFTFPCFCLRLIPSAYSRIALILKHSRTLATVWYEEVLPKKPDGVDDEALRVEYLLRRAYVY